MGATPEPLCRTCGHIKVRHKIGRCSMCSKGCGAFVPVTVPDTPQPPAHWTVDPEGETMFYGDNIRGPRVWIGQGDVHPWDEPLRPVGWAALVADVEAARRLPEIEAERDYFARRRDALLADRDALAATLATARRHARDACRAAGKAGYAAPVAPHLRALLDTLLSDTPDTGPEPHWEDGEGQEGPEEEQA